MTQLAALSPAIALALSKVALAKPDRDAVQPGVYNIDETLAVKVSGTMEVLEDTKRVPTVSIPLKEALALFIAYSGITRESAMNALRRAMTDALSQSSEGQGKIAAALPVVAETMAVVESEILAKLPKTPVKGAVKPKLSVKVIALPKDDAAQTPAAAAA
jgi:hypothetical protein